MPLFIGEVCLITYFLWLLLRLTVFIVIIQLLILTYVNGQIDLMKHQLRNISMYVSIRVGRLRTSFFCGRWLSIKILKQLYAMHREHLQLSVYFCRAYQELWGPFFLIFITFSVPINVISLLSLRSLGNGSERILVYLMFFIHSSSLISLLGNLTVQTHLLHSVARYLSTIIPAIKFSRLKFRYENWHDRLNNGKKYGPSFEPFGTITNRTILNVSIKKN